MKKTLLVTACVFASTLALAKDSARHSKDESRSMTSRTETLSDLAVSRGERQSIGDMNDFRYSKTFGVHELKGEKAPQAMASEEWNPDFHKRADAAMVRWTRGEQTGAVDSETSTTGGDVQRVERTERTERTERVESTDANGDSQGISGWFSSDDESAGVDSETGSETGATEEKTEMKSDRKDDGARMESDSATPGMAASDEGMTADQHPRNERDLAITRQIRQEIMNDEELSVRAQNLTIVTNNGRVSIRGTVDSAQEKSGIEQIARKVSGVTSVDNNVVVKN